MGHLKSLSDKEGDLVALLPFVDIHGYQPEPLLPFGTPFLVYDMFSDANANLIHPSYSLAVITGAGLPLESLNDAKSAKTLADKLGARYAVFGSVQKSSQTQVRVIINILDAKKNTVLSPPTEFAAELNDAFFDLMRTNIVKAFSRAGGHLKASSYKDPSLLSFRYYVRGLELSQSYNRTNLDVAVLWFEKALKENYHHYDDAALGMARAHFMMALLEKLAKSDFTQNMILGRKAYAYYKGKTTTPKARLTTRFLESQAAFLSAITALKNGKAPLAQKEATRALSLTPEDGMAEHAYWTSGAGVKGKFVRNQPLCF